MMVNPVYHFPMADKQKGKGAPATFKGEFSFVNKDATNIDSKEHHNAVSWHVMNRYEKFKKQEEARKLRASANVPVSPMSTPSSPQATSEVGSSSWLGYCGQSLTIPQQNRAIPMSTAPGFEFWSADQSLQPRYPNTTLAPSTTSTPSTHSSMLEEPFSTLGLSSSTFDFPSSEASSLSELTNSSLANSLVAFAYETILPSIWPSDLDNPSVAYEVARSSDDLAAMYQDSCFANAYLALIAEIKSTADADETMHYYSRIFQGQAMTELRRRVSQQGPPDLMTMKAILKLFCSETIADNTSVARVHLKTLRNLVTAAGGIVLLDPWFREDLLSCDSYFALKYGTRPLLPAQGWTPGSLSQPWKARLTSAAVFGDHANNLDASIEHPTLKTVLTDLRELFKVQEYALSHDIPADDQLLRWRQLRRFDCISRLADHGVNLKIYPHLYDNPNTQALITTAAALMANMVLGCPESVTLGLKLLEDLKQNYVESEAEAPEEKDRLRLWVLYIGSCAENIHPASPTTQVEWFRSRMREVGARLKIRNWDDMRKVLRHFLFSERLQREIGNLRQYRTADFRPGLFSNSATSWRLPDGINGRRAEDESNWKGKQRA